MIKRLSHISLATGQLERMIEFYCDHLDCRVVHEFRNAQNERYGAFLAIGDSATFLELFNSPDARPGAPALPLRHICFEVESIEETAAAFTALGFNVEVKRGRSDGVLQFTITDPDSNEIEFHHYDADCALWPYVSHDAKDGGHEH